MSEFHIECVRIGAVLKHPNADRLELTSIHADEDGQGGYPVIFQAGTYKEGDLAVYVPVDSVVPENDEWSWLWENVPNPPARKRRIKAKKLRGVFSMGVLTGIPESLKNEDPKNIVGLDVADLLGITKYEDPEESEGPVNVSRGQHAPMSWYTKAWRWVMRKFGVTYRGDGPKYGLPAPKVKRLPGYYDIEAYRKYASRWFKIGEDVVVLEKIHGQNASFVSVYENGDFKLHMKSRTRWRENTPTDPANAWARVAERYNLAEKLARIPGVIVYGEAYGNFSDLPYGASKESPGFAVFDAFNTDTGKWYSWPDLVDICDALDLPIVPMLARGTWDDSRDFKSYAEGKTTLAANHVREGFVIRPVHERTINGGQRVILKHHGEGFLTRKDGDAKVVKVGGAIPDPVTTEYGLVDLMRPAKLAA